MTFSGIYKICSKTHPDRCYIGSAVDMYRRRREHLSYLKGNKHFSKKLQFHYNKYGKDDLEFFVVSVCDREDLFDVEQRFLDSCKPYFNTSTLAKVFLCAHQNEETRLKISRSKLGKKRPPFSEEAKKNMSVAHSGSRNYMFGKHHSDETRRKIGDKSRGRIQSEESRKKGGLARRGRVVSIETRQKLSIAKKGVKKTLEARMKMSSTKQFNARMKKMNDIPASQFHLFNNQKIV